MHTSSTDPDRSLSDTISVSKQLKSNMPLLFSQIDDEHWNMIEQNSLTLFYPWQFERLLNSAADLLDRAGEDRTTLIQLMAQDFLLRLDLEASDLKIQHDKLRTNIPGEALDTPVAFAALNLLRLNGIESQKGEVVEAFKTQVDNLKEFTTTDSSNAGKLRNWRAVADISAAVAQQKQFGISVSNSKREADAEAEEVDRNRKQVEMAIRQQRDKVIASTNGGELDASFEANIVARRMWRDYLEAMARLIAASKGLKDILGLEDTQLKPSSDIRAIDAIVNAQEQARQLILWHSQQTQFDQGFTVVISLREFCTKSEWLDFLKGGYRLMFPVDTLSFASWRMPRIRGVSATYSGADSRSIRLHVTAPELAVRSDGTQIKQPAPPCVLGRVLNATSPREPEICGAVTLMNVCPLQAKGHSWVAELHRFGPTSKVKDYVVDDIVIELTCLGIPSKMAPSLLVMPLDGLRGPKPETTK